MYFNSIKQLGGLSSRIRKQKTLKVAQLAKVDIKLVRAIRNGVPVNPTIGTLDKINEALNKLEGIENE